MTSVRYKPFTPKGSVYAPPSKSDVHRAIICAALSKGKCEVSPVALSNDIRATIGCVEALGAKTEIKDGALTVDGTGLFQNKTALLDCGESGSTLRFFIPIAAAGGVSARFVGRGSLVTRPIGLFSDILPGAGVACETKGTLPLAIDGTLKNGRFEVPGNVSSQFITGLLFALPLLDGDSEIVLTSPLQSAGYIQMTIYTMSKFGVEVERTDSGWRVRGNQRYVPRNYTTDGDWSQAAFYLVSGAVNGELTVKNLNRGSAQGDKKIVDLLRKFGAELTQTETEVTVRKSQMKAITIDASQIPDLVPVLAVCANFAEGTTRIINAERLKIKESNRLETTASLLNALGGRVTVLDNGLEVVGAGILRGGKANGSNDHRIIMSAAACAAGLDGTIECTDALSVNKSYPDFFEDYNSAGGKSELF